MPTSIFKALSDPTRLRIVKFISSREMCVCEILPYFKMSQPAISQHLKILKSAGILESRKEKQKVCYRLKNKRILNLIKLAETFR